MGLNIKDLVKDLREARDEIMGADGEKLAEYREILEKGAKGLDQVKDLLRGLASEDPTVVEHALTKWEDVNRTLLAIGKMQHAIDTTKRNKTIVQVLEVIGKGASIALTLAAAV